MLNMPRAEILATRYGEMLDMLNCMGIHNGADPADPRGTCSDFDETLEVI